MKVNIAVCGKFHYANYIRYIDTKGYLGNFYYSHKRSTTAGILGIQSSKSKNLWMKEYLLHAHLRTLKERYANDFFPRYQKLWESQVIKNWERADIFHVMSQGTSINLVEHAKKHGSIIIGEPVNSHPKQVMTLMNQEYERLGINKKIELNKGQEQQIEEINYFDYLITPSEFVRKSFINEGFDADKVFLLPFGTNVSSFRRANEYKKGDDIFRVICVAQMSLRKAHIDLFEAWDKMGIPKEKRELILVGSLTLEMKGIFEKYKDQVTYLGILPHNELYKYYNQADVFVLPSIEEGCSYVPLEAMACGIPVIVSENTGSGELVEHGKEGFVVPIRSPKKIAEYLEFFYKNPEERQTMSNAALNKAGADFGWENYSKKLINIYEQIHQLS